MNREVLHIHRVEVNSNTNLDLNPNKTSEAKKWGTKYWGWTTVSVICEVWATKITDWQSITNLVNSLWSHEN